MEAPSGMVMSLTHLASRHGIEVGDDVTVGVIVGGGRPVVGEIGTKKVGVGGIDVISTPVTGTPGVKVAGTCVGMLTVGGWGASLGENALANRGSTKKVPTP